MRAGRPDRWRWLRAAGAAMLLAVVPGVSAAVGQGIRATIDRPEATIQDQLVLVVTVEGSRSAEPTLPELPDFDVFPRGQSSQISIVNGRATTSITHTYVLVPHRVGTFTIGPATVEIDGQTLSSEPFQVSILEAAAQPREAREIWVSARVSTTEPWVGQQVVYTWQLFRRVRVGDARLEQDDLDGFVVEELGDVREYTTTVGGREYVVNEIRKALFPQEPGKTVVPASRLSCRVEVRQRGRRSVFEDVFGRAMSETKVLRTPAIELDVRPLPPSPPGFSGLVGDFGITARINKRELQVGESATLRLEIEGTGNVRMIGEPQLPPLPYLKIYDDRPGSDLDRSGRMLKGSKTYRKALVPLEPGELTIPPLSLTFFDPESGTYRTAQTAEIALLVSPAAGEEELRLTESLAPSTGKVAVRILADDILPLYKGLDAVSRPLLERAPAVAGAGLLAPPVLCLALLVAERRRRRFEQDESLRRRRGALRRARRELRRIAGAAGDDGHAAARDASRCLREYVGDKLALEGTALTPAEVEAGLRERGVDEDLVREVHELLQRLEAAQFGAAEVEPEELPGKVRPLLAALERTLR